MTALELIRPVLAAGACHLAMWRAGAWLRPWILGAAPADEYPAERAFVEAMLGFAALACAAVALAALHLLYGTLLAAAIVALAAAGVASLYRLRARFRLPRSAAAAPMVAAVAIVLAFLPSALYPVLENDENVYHLLIAKLDLAAHAFAAQPWSLYANMPHLVDLAYAFPTALGDFTAAKVFVLGFVLWTFAGMAGLAGEALGPWGPGILALLLLSGRDVQWHLGLAYVEPVIAGLLLGALLSLRAWWRDRDREGQLVLLGVLGGAACASKYTVWPHAAALVLAAAAAGPRLGAPSRARRLALAAGPAALVVAPWLVKSAVLTGNPLYPNLFGLLGGVHWSRIQDFQLHSYLAAVGGAAKTWRSYAAIPFELVVSPFGRFDAASVSAGVMALGVASLALPWRREEFSTPLRLLAVAGVVAWAMGPQGGRFLVAWVPVLVVTAGLALAPLRGRPALLAAAMGAVALAAGAQIRWQPYRTRPVLDVFRVPRDELVARNYAWNLTQLLNREVPPDGGVAAFWENRLYFLDRPFVADSVYESPAVLARLREVGDPAAFARELARDGVTHVVINPGLLLTYVQNRFPERIVDDRIYPLEALRADARLLESFVLSELEPVPWDGYWRVYRLRQARRTSGGGRHPGIRNSPTPPSTATGSPSASR